MKLNQNTFVLSQLVRDMKGSVTVEQKYGFQFWNFIFDTITDDDDVDSIWYETKEEMQ